jgi:uncharacterized phage protein (TIGR01671 family)
MNRIPNYRVWHKIEKRFVELRTINFEKQDISYDAFREANYEDISSFDDVVFQQWTGLKDTKGVEIFEGDIIKGMFDMGPAGEILQTATVYWDDLKGYQWNYWNLDTIEIIGNIFEK